ncbi:MAG: EpsG family protein [Oscillospiraceae bacterium]|nr:EpsG family protein [Oscillospiraceae bacterium]
MSQYILILIWIMAMFLVKELVNVGYSPVYISGKKEYRVSMAFATFAFAPVIIMTTFRRWVGDTEAYRRAFNDLPDTIIGLIRHLPNVKKDTGFTVLGGLIKCVISSDIFYFFIIAVIQGMILVHVYRKYSIDYLFSVFLFIASTDYISWMFNGMRQFTAVTLMFAATELMLQKKWMPTILIILLAATMHQSALLMIPIVIIAHGEAWNIKSILFLAATLVAVMFVDQFTDILDIIMQETQYSSMVSDWTSWGDDGTNAIRVLVYSVPTILAAIGIKYIRQANDPVINFCTNMSIVSTGLYIISMFTSGIFMGRLPIYASLYNYILLPWEIDNIFTRQSARLVKLTAIVAYIGFYYYQIFIQWGMH